MLDPFFLTTCFSAFLAIRFDNQIARGWICSTESWSARHLPTKQQWKNSLLSVEGLLEARLNCSSIRVSEGDCRSTLSLQPNIFQHSCPAELHSVAKLSHAMDVQSLNLTQGGQKEWVTGKNTAQEKATAIADTNRKLSSEVTSVQHYSKSYTQPWLTISLVTAKRNFWINAYWRWV